MLGLLLLLSASAGSAEEKPRFLATVWGGPSTVRLGDLEKFPAVVADERLRAQEPFGGKETVRDSGGINWAFAEGLDLSFQVDPLVRVMARVGYLRTSVGTFRSEIELGGSTLVDDWRYWSDVLFVSGGGGFIIPYAEKSRFMITLFLGTGFADAHIRHDYFVKDTDGLTQGVAEVSGSGFFPEFAVEWEHDLRGLVTIGAILGYRFGGVSTFKYRNRSQASLVLGTVEAEEGDPVRYAGGNFLSADYGGILASILLSYWF